MQYSWDNSAENVRNPNRPPRPVAYGGQSSDEMGTVILQLSLRDEADLARLSEASARHRIARWPGDWNAHRRLGHLLAARGDHAGAIAHYRRLVRYQPELASGHYNLALSYQRDVRPAAATKHYRRALEIEPEHLDALNNLGVVLASQGKLDRAIRLFRRALSIDPAFARARKNLDHALALKRNTASGRSAAAD
jgi:tetratricopeptide (TPR) repeat protein